MYRSPKLFSSCKIKTLYLLNNTLIPLSQLLVLSILPFVSIHFLILLLSTSVVSDSVRPHRQQPTRLPCPWDSPGKNTGVGCHFLLQCMKVKRESEKVKVLQSYPTRSDPMDCSLPGSFVLGIFQAGVLEWGAIAFSVPLVVYIRSFSSVQFSWSVESDSL